jgi:multicomponent Na+:H+ antiporter subunit E
MSHLRHAISLGLFLFAIWLLLSGHYTPLLLVTGLLSTLFIVGIAIRIDLVDRETHHVLLKPATLLYWGWLGREIVRSSIDVTRCILDPKLPISPTVTRVKAGQRTGLGRTTYVNSITLVPGTVSMDLDADTITVHALTRRYAEVLENGDMDRRVSAVEKIF